MYSIEYRLLGLHPKARLNVGDVIRPIKYDLPLLRRWQGALRHMCIDPNYNLHFASFMLGAHLSLEDGDERAFRESFRFIYYPSTDAELVAFAIQAASWAGVPNTF